MFAVKKKKTLPHSSTLNHKSRLVNPTGINVFYHSLKVKVNVVSVNMKNNTMNVVFVVISHVLYCFEKINNCVVLKHI